LRRVEGLLLLLVGLVLLWVVRHAARLHVHRVSLWREALLLLLLLLLLLRCP
jgi:hypothetical protein